MNWQPIETAPKDGTKIDVWVKTWRSDSDSFQYWRVADTYWRQSDSISGRSAGWSNCNDLCVTHWMPIPEGPQE